MNKQPKVCIRCRKSIRKRLERAPKPKKQIVKLQMPVDPGSQVYDRLMKQEIGCFVYSYNPSDGLTQVWKNKWMYGNC
jgi:hypothetical protein